MPRLQALYDERATLHNASKKILDTADTAKRALSAEETAEWDRMDARISELSTLISRNERTDARQAALDASEGRRTDPQPIIPSHPANSAEHPNGNPNGAISLSFNRRHKPLEFAAGSPYAARAGNDYRHAFADYLANARPGANLQTADDTKGGYLVPTTMASTIIQAVDDLLWIRQLANVLPPIPGNRSLGVVSLDADPADADWTAEVPASAMTADTTTAFGKRELTPHLMAKLLKMSMKLLRAGMLNAEQYVGDRVAYKVAVTEEKAFLTGSGVKRPLGVFTASDLGVPTSRDITCASATTPVADEFIDCFYNVKPQYQQSGVWIMHRDMVKRVRKFKDGDGQYLWQPGLAPGQPTTILTRPVYSSEFAPNTFTTGLYVALFADLKAGYWIADGIDIEIQRLNELFAATNQVGLIARKETDGMPVLAEAFSRLKLA